MLLFGPCRRRQAKAFYKRLRSSDIENFRDIEFRHNIDDNKINNVQNTPVQTSCDMSSSAAALTASELEIYTALLSSLKLSPKEHDNVDLTALLSGLGARDPLTQKRALYLAKRHAERCPDPVPWTDFFLCLDCLAEKQTHIVAQVQ